MVELTAFKLYEEVRAMLAVEEEARIYVAAAILEHAPASIEGTRLARVADALAALDAWRAGRLGEHTRVLAEAEKLQAKVGGAGR